jgi:hypothetical protein
VDSHSFGLIDSLIRAMFEGLTNLNPVTDPLSLVVKLERITSLTFLRTRGLRLVSLEALVNGANIEKERTQTNLLGGLCAAQVANGGAYAGRSHKESLLPVPRTNHPERRTGSGLPRAGAALGRSPAHSFPDW